MMPKNTKKTPKKVIRQKPSKEARQGISVVRKLTKDGVIRQTEYGLEMPYSGRVVAIEHSWE